MTTISPAQPRLGYVDEGPSQGGTPGRTIVLLHGSASSRRQWGSFLATRKENERVIAPDLPGYGESTAFGDVSGGEKDLLAVSDLLEDLTGELPIDLIGHSYGGALALELAVRKPAWLRSLTLIEPVAFRILHELQDIAWRDIEELSSEHIRLVEQGACEEAAARFMTYWIGSEAWSSMPLHRRQAVVSVMAKVAREWQWMWRQSGEFARHASLQMPIHIIVGTCTTRAARRVSEILAARLPDATMSWINQAGHLSPLTHPDQVNAVVRQFLADVGAEDGVRVPSEKFG